MSTVLTANERQQQSNPKHRTTMQDIGEGVGTEIYRRTKRYRIPDPPVNCPCISMAQQMNQNGPDWCEQHEKEAARQIAHNATNEAVKWVIRKVMRLLVGPVLRHTIVPLLSIPARFLLVRPAIRTVRSRIVVRVVGGEEAA